MIPPQTSWSGDGGHGQPGAIILKCHHTKCCPGSLGPGMGERKGNSSVPSLMAGAGSTQPKMPMTQTRTLALGSQAPL